MNLYTLGQEYREAFFTLAEMDIDEQTIADTLEGLEGELKDKVLAVAKYQQGLVAESKAIKDAVKGMLVRAKALDNKADSFKRYISEAMTATGELKANDEYISLSFRKSVVVEVDADVIDNRWMVEKVSISPDKLAIKKALQDGEEVDGAVLQINHNLQIK